ncbi:SDR family NAD(P)-dependent oxidoreductase [Alkalibacillus almallahensis]|uniref:SDR family NAD(P)-dependent oxidoreductase n=1 Tax=Alkalibacillus almallahensis TaxID=1379154 RepID=UPI0014206C93|nr:glucose 1-dehydrogenase [Alkalibacillus almallahensis]NIK13120.1 NAD(P)-dependent dehydrogenase (short-subunit alcohol dehydrogenase family) [Alkalibacillus almallahensis]
MQGKTVLITGGAGGIGMETAKAFLDDGANVALVDISADALKNAKDKLNQPDKILTIEADVTNEAEVKQYVDETVETYGSVDVFFNNAAVAGPATPIKELEKDTFEQIMGINTTGVFLGMKHVIQQMEKQGYGAIINAASNAAYIGSANMVGYIASKHAVAGMTKTAALEEASHGIRINAVAPAAIDTNMLTGIQENLSPDDPNAAAEAIKQGIPVGRFGTPKDVSAVVKFLASDEAAFVTGSLYNVDGGMQAD